MNIKEFDSNLISLPVRNACAEFCSELKELHDNSDRPMIIVDGLPKKVRDIWAFNATVQDRKAKLNMSDKLDAFNSMLSEYSGLVFFRYHASHLVCCEDKVQRSESFDLSKDTKAEEPV